MITQWGALSDKAEINPKHRNVYLKRILFIMRLND